MPRVIRSLSYFYFNINTLDTGKCLMIQKWGFLYQILYSRGTCIVWCLINPLPCSVPLWVWQPHKISTVYIQFPNDKILRKERKGVLAIRILRLDWVLIALGREEKEGIQDEPGGSAQEAVQYRIMDIPWEPDVCLHLLRLLQQKTTDRVAYKQQTHISHRSGGWNSRSG